MSTQGASPTSSSSLRQWKNDVFLSFRGMDICNNFVDHLSHALSQNRISTVTAGGEKFDGGDSISHEHLKLIAKSRVAIVIFSKDYASSTLRLNELEVILRCKREMRMIILPIFYYVNPPTVQKQMETFAKAFTKHEVRFKENMEKVHTWRAVLREVASLAGWNLQENRLQSQVVENIVEVISNLLENMFLAENSLYDRAYIAKMVKEKDLGPIHKFGRTQIIATALGIDSEKGILGHEQVLRSLRIARTLSTIKTSALGFFQFLPKSCYNFTILLLFVSAVLSLGFGLKEEGLSTGWYEGVIIILAIIILVIVDTLREFQLDHSQLMSGKHKLLGRQIMMVDVFIRGGFQKVNFCDVLIGDIVRLKEDYTVPADGLFIAGETLILDDDHHHNGDDFLSRINEKNPFLFCGAKVIEGNGLMIVASVGMDTRLGDLMKQVTHVPDKTPLPRQLDKVNKGTQIFGLSISILMIVVLFIRFKLLKEDVNSNLPDLKGKPNTMKEIMDATEKIVMKPNGKISSLATSLSMLLVGVMEGIPFVITLAISYWNKKMLSDQAIAQEPFACLTMSSVTSICIDTTGWRSSKLNTEEVGREIKALKNYGFNVILVSEDSVSVLETIALECGLLPSSNRLVLGGEDFCKYDCEERMRMVDDIVLIGNSTPSDHLTLVQYLKKKDHKVAMVGIKANAIPALKEADVGIAMSTCSNEMARANSDIFIGDRNFSSLFTIVRFGRCTFENIQKYIQLELTMTIAGLLITSITTMFCGYSPITSIQFLWANFVVAFLGGLGLLTEPPADEQMERLPLRRAEPQRRAEPLITKAMWRNIVSQALYQVAILVIFQFKGQTIPGIKKVSKTLIFNSFVMCQVFNQVNAREVEKKNVFKSIHRNPLFGVAVGVNLLLQVAFIEIAHILVGNARLNWVQWFICLLVGMFSWACDWVTKSAPIEKKD